MSRVSASLSRLARAVRRWLFGCQLQDFEGAVENEFPCWLCKRTATTIYLVDDTCRAVCEWHDPRRHAVGKEWCYMREFAPDESTIQAMRQYRGRFAAYQNGNPEDPEFGQLRFLRYGHLSRFPLPPTNYPAVGYEPYKLIGFVNLDTGWIQNNEFWDPEWNRAIAGADDRLAPPADDKQRLWCA